MFAAGRQCYWMRVRRCHQCPVPGPRPTQLWNDKPGPGHSLRPVCGDIMTHQILLHLQPNLDEGNKVFCSFNRGQAFGIVHCIVNVVHSDKYPITIDLYYVWWWYDIAIKELATELRAYIVYVWWWLLLLCSELIARSWHRLRTGRRQGWDSGHKSFKRRSTQRFVIMEKAPTRAFSGLKAASTALTLVKTQLLRHYAKRVLTSWWVYVKLGCRRKSQ